MRVAGAEGGGGGADGGVAGGVTKRWPQLYFDNHLWNALHALAKSRKTTISNLVRQAVRNQYCGKRDDRAKAMQEFVGIRKDRSDTIDAAKYVRGLRRGGRLKRLAER
jgi:hypothetical protein